MNIAVIFAGGTGQRMNSKTKPKQFLELHGKPILVYTIEQFQYHKEIDGIVVVCLPDWIDYCTNLVKQYRLDKVDAIVPGGDSGQQSIFNGLQKAHELYPEDSVVLIHDGVRPLINDACISDNIASVKENGPAITVSPAIETIAIKSDSGEIEEILDRKRCQMAKAPQSFRLKDIYETHLKARAAGAYSFIDSACLMRHYGFKIYTVEGPSENIKITTPSDFYIFRAIVDARENSQIFGL